jgi:hypothetical protein
MLFKDIRKLYAQWKAEGEYELTPKGKIRRLSTEMMHDWRV